MLLHNEFSLLPQQEADPTAPRACHGNILVMDDQESLCEIAQANLSYVGYSVTVAAHGKAVIELYQKALSEQNPFDLFILDLIVPGAMGGLETLQELLKIDPSVKAIITSGYPNNQILLEPHKHGFKGMLAKPYLKEELREMVRQTIMACNLPPPRL